MPGKSGRGVVVSVGGLAARNPPVIVSVVSLPLARNGFPLFATNNSEPVMVALITLAAKFGYPMSAAFSGGDRILRGCGT